jgi:heptosyltransferase-2/heptosyltransferase-3
MTRADLAARNVDQAAQRHRLTRRERLRRVLLQLAAVLPTRRGAAPDRDTFVLIRPDHVGDALLSMPAIQALKRARPYARLVVLAGPWAAEVFAAYPDVDLVLTIPFPGFNRGARGGLLEPYRLALRWAGQMRALHAGTALILRPDHWWGALLARQAGIPERIGYNVPDVAPFLTRRVRFQPQHAVLQSLMLVSPWVGMPGASALDHAPLRFPVVDEDRAYVQSLLSIALAPDQPFIVIHPGAGSPIKSWPPERWAAAADRLCDRVGAVAVFTGSDREHTAIWAVLDRMRNRGISLAGETNVAQLAAVYERAGVVLGPDTGPLHLAVAVGTPSVHLFGPADPVQFGPWGDPARHVVVSSDIGCRPCRILDWAGDNPDYHPCVREIPVQQVVDAALAARRTGRDGGPESG